MGFDPDRTVLTAAEWRDRPEWATVPSLEPPSGPVVVFAAHADDETLGLGALLSRLDRAGTEVVVVIVTDGAASYGVLDAEATGLLVATRRQEARSAVAALHRSAAVEFWGLPDTGLPSIGRVLAEAVTEVVDRYPTALLLSTWRGDGHGDHEALGAAVAEAAARVGAEFAEYPVWLWQWGDPDAVPWDRLMLLPVDETDLDAKAEALRRYASQTSAADTPDGRAVLAPSFLEHALSGRETIILPPRSSSTRLLPVVTSRDPAGHEHFDVIHRSSPDPWNFESSAYERRKRAITLAVLPEQRMLATLEIGCSIGVLSSELATRSDRFLGVDVSPTAVEAATGRLDRLGHPDARAVVATIPDRWPDAGARPELFDLVVVSEVAYYLDRTAWDRTIDGIRERLLPGGTVLLCHWLHPEPDFAQSGRAVHERFATRSGFRRRALHEEDDFLLETWSAGEPPASGGRRSAR